MTSRTHKDEASLSVTPDDARLFPRGDVKKMPSSPSVPIMVRRSQSQIRLQEVEAAAEERANEMLQLIQSARSKRVPQPQSLQHLLFPSRVPTSTSTYDLPVRPKRAFDNKHQLPVDEQQEDDDLQFDMEL